jgi:predicted DNA-binding transcriptional regulator AlpA
MSMSRALPNSSSTSPPPVPADLEPGSPVQLVAQRDDEMPALLNLTQAAAMLGLCRTTAYKLVRDEVWPTPVVKLGRLIKIPSAPLLALIAGRWPTPDANRTDHGGPH